LQKVELAAHRPSYEAINYTIRPAKSIERKMLVESFRLLGPFAPPHKYAYVGFGSTFFVDFSLIHRGLGITDLTSIEKDVGKKDRFEFNKPLKCINLDMRSSTQVLPELKWGKKSIVWLDYDGKLSDRVLADVGFFFDLACSGSVLVISLQANVDSKGKRVDSLKKRIQDPTKIPADTTEDTLEEWGTAETYYRIINNEIGDSLAARNGVLNAEDKLVYRQLYHFYYADGAKMITVGGVLHSAKDSLIFDQCDFVEKLDFVRTGKDPYTLFVPSLTLRELQHLDKQLPCGSDEALAAAGVPTSDLQTYRRIYRYYPRFTESELW
jgi:hypothetical protein